MNSSFLMIIDDCDESFDLLIRDLMKPRSFIRIATLSPWINLSYFAAENCGPYL